MKNPLRWLARSLVYLSGQVEIELLFWGFRHGIDGQSLPMRTHTFNLFLTDLAQWGYGHDWPGDWWSLYCWGRVHLFRHPEGCVSCKLSTGMWPTRTGIMGQVRHTWKHLG